MWICLSLGMCIINNEKSTQIERVIFIQSLIYCSNEFNTYDAQCTFIEQFITPIANFFGTADFQNAMGNVQVFVKYLGLDNDQQNEAASLQVRRQLFYYVNVLFSILKSVRHAEDSNEIKNLSNSDYTQRLKNPAFGSYIKILEPILAILKSMNIIHSSDCSKLVKTEYLEMTEAAKIMALGMNQQGTSSAINVNIQHDQEVGKDDANSCSDKIHMFFYNVYETLNQTIPMYFQKFKNELLLVESSEYNLQFVQKLGDALFANFNEVPDFRMRQIIRYTLKSGLSFNIKTEYIEKDYVVVRLNELLLEYFLPSILTKINIKIKHFKSLKEESKHLECVRSNTESSSIQSQIIEENQFVLMCRDVVELLRLFLNVSVGSTYDGQEDLGAEQGEDMEKSGRAENQNPNLIVLSELAGHLLKKNKVIFQATLLLLFEG